MPSKISTKLLPKETLSLSPKSQLTVIRMTNGERIIAEMNYVDNKSTIAINRPIFIEVHRGEHGEELVSYEFLPGTDQESFIIPVEGLIIGDANAFMRKFYGSALYRFYYQHQIQRLSLTHAEELDDYAKTLLQLKRIELIKTYGFLHDDTDYINGPNMVH